MTDVERFEPLIVRDNLDKCRAKNQVDGGVPMEGFPATGIERPLSATDLAPIIGLHSVTILRWAREGRIPHHRLSARKIVFLPSEINQWLACGSGLYAIRVGHAA